MRTITSAQTADQLEQHRRDGVRVYVANGSDVLTEHTDVREVTVDADVDRPAMTAEVVIQRETSAGTKMFDLATDIDARRRVQIDAVVLSDDETPVSGDWLTIFEGKTENPAGSSNDTRLVLPCIDNWQILRSRWDLDGTTSYGNDGTPVAVENVIQQQFDDVLGSGGLTLEVVGTPTTTIKAYTPPIQSLAARVQALLDIDGWDLRWKWNESNGAFSPTFYEPARSNTTPDHTFGTDDYFGVPQIAKVVSDIRNVVRVIYDSAGSYVEARDSTSIALYGEEPLVLDYSQDSQITTSGLASSLAAAVLTDVSMPAVEMVARGRFFPWVELGDLYRFPNDNVLHGQIDLAVTGFTHRITPDVAETTLRLRGTPSGGVTRWFNKAKRSQEARELQEVVGTLEPNTDTVIPTVEAKTSQSSGVGTVTLVVNDPSGYVDAVSFESFNSGGDFDASTDPTGWSGYDNSAPFTLSDTVNLVEGHNSFIAWAVRYDLGAGGVWIRNVVTFDRDLVPNFVCGLHLDGTSVYLSQTGDEDFASLTYADSKVSMPADAAADSGTVINGRTTDGTEIETGMSDGDTLYVKATGWSSTGGTGTQSNTYWRGQIGYTAPGNTPRPPTIRVQTDQNGATGTLALTISDPDSVVNATSFESTNGGGDYDFSTDPSTWTDYDNSAPYGLTDTVTISDKHISKIGWAVRYDLGEGAGNEWVQGEATFDSDVNPEINGVIIGFDDDGIPLISLVGDEDSSGCVVGVAVGSNPTAPATGTQTTLSGAEAAGQTVLSVTSSAGFTPGNYGVLYDGTQSELVYITSTGASTVTVNPAIVNSYSSGANFDEVENTGGDPGEYGGGVLAQSGTVKLEAAGSGGPEQTLNVGIGEEIRVIAAAVGNAGVGPATGIIRRRRGDTQYIKPTVQVYAARSTDDIILTLDIEDPSLAIQANSDIDWRVRDGDTQAWGAYSSTWTSTTGTAGSATTLQRTKTIAATDDDNAIGWRITYVNENGDSVDLGDDVDLASATLVTKTIRVAPTMLAANATTHSWGIGYDGTYGILLQNKETDGTSKGYYQHVPLPVGVDLTNIECRFLETASTSALVYLYGQTTVLGTVTATGSGLDSASLSHTTTSQLYYVNFEYSGHNAANQVGIYWVDITYESGSFRQTY